MFCRSSLAAVTSYYFIFSPSILLQIRIYDHNGVYPVLIKGTLTPTAALPAKTIIVTSSMVKAPSVDPTLRSWQQRVLIPGMDYELWSMLPKSALCPDGGYDGQVAAMTGDGVDLAIVSSKFCWHQASLNMDLTFILDRHPNTQLREFLKE